MKWNRIVIKLGATIILLFLLILLPLGFVINQIFTGFYYSKTQEQMDQLAARYAKSIVSGHDRTMNVQMIAMMSEFTGVPVYMTDSQGNVLASSGVGRISAGTSFPVEDIKQLSGGKSLHRKMQDPETGTQYLVAGYPVVEGSDFVGGVFVLSSIEGIEESLHKVRDLLILSGIGAFCLALGFTLVLSRTLSSPLVQMERAARQIAKGDLDVRVHVPSGDEVGSLARAINELAVDLKQYRDTRSELFANISHELRTPMTYLEGYAKVLKEGMVQSEAEKEQYLDIMYQEAKRLTHIIQDVFELSKMEEGKISLNREWIDLVEVAEQTLHKLEPKAKEKGLTLTTCFPSVPLHLFADGIRMEQVFMNLLNNAIRYTESGSISVEISAAGPYEAVVVIEDTGIGIPEQELPFIFERFYRVEKSRSREHGGTGLGLAIVKKLVEVQGGSIQVTSKLGEGTRFEIRFVREGEGFR